MAPPGPSWRPWQAVGLVGGALLCFSFSWNSEAHGAVEGLGSLLWWNASATVIILSLFHFFWGQSHMTAFSCHGAMDHCCRQRPQDLCRLPRCTKSAHLGPNFHPVGPPRAAGSDLVWWWWWRYNQKRPLCEPDVSAWNATNLHASVDQRHQAALDFLCLWLWLQNWLQERKCHEEAS